IGNIYFNRAICDLRASINLIPLSIFEKLRLGDLKATKITLQLADRSSVHLKGVLEDVLVKMSTIDLEENESTMKIDGETETLKCGHQLSKKDGKRELGEQCKNLSISNVIGSRDTLPFIHVERINMFKERDKRAKANYGNETIDRFKPPNFANLDIEKYFTELQEKTFIQETAFDPLMVLCKEIWPLVRYHKWEHFLMIPKNNVVVPIIQEFYASLHDQESRNIEGRMWDMNDFIDEIDLEYFRDMDMDICKVVSQTNKDWNKRQQDMTTTLTLSQRLTQAQQDIGENSHPKLDWMIQWMQELGPIFKEFMRQNNIWVPNYTLDMFELANMEHGEEVHNIKEDEEDDKGEEMDFKEND
ncbi:hypothetical protein Golob_013073, partial [Gossypium lobatum]|nr:hypothetical protein [Gossypium lobatum]